MHPLRSLPSMPPSPEERGLPITPEQRDTNGSNKYYTKVKKDLYVALLKEDKLIKATNSPLARNDTHGDWEVLADKSIVSIQSNELNKLKDYSFRNIVICSHGGEVHDSETDKKIDVMYWLDGENFISSSDILNYLDKENRVAKLKNDEIRRVSALEAILKKASDAANIVFTGCSVGSDTDYGLIMLDAIWQLAGKRVTIYINKYSGKISNGYQDKGLTNKYGIEIGGDLTFHSSKHGFLVKNKSGVISAVNKIFLDRTSGNLKPLDIK
jgi:hypothetical protein